MHRGLMVRIRVNASERAALMVAARGRSLTLSGWARMVLMEGALSEMHKAASAGRVDDDVSRETKAVE